MSADRVPTSTSKASPVASTPSTGRRVLVNTGSLAGSSMWRIVISFVLQVLITRVMGVESFGQYVSAMAYLNVAQVVSELGLASLLVRDLAPVPSQRRAYFSTALTLQLIAAVLTWAVLIGFTWLAPLSTATQNALWLVGASLPFYAVTSATQTLFKAAERMELVMGVEATINTLIMAISIVVLMTGGSIARLIGVLVLTQIISAMVCLWLLWRARLLAAPQERLRVDLSTLWRNVRPFYWLSLTDVLLHRLDILLLNIVAGDLVTGTYSIAYSVVRVLVKLIQSYWQALYPTLSRLRRHAERQYKVLSGVSLRYALMLILPAAALGTGAAADLLVLLYHDKAGASVVVFRILLWMAPLFLVELYGITQLMVEHWTRNSLHVTWLHIGVVLLLLPPLTLWWGADGAAAAMVIAAGAGAIGACILTLRRGIPLYVAKIYVLLPATALTLAIALWLPVTWPARLVVGGLVYLAIVWATGVFSPGDREIFRNALKGDARRLDP